jgi:hypothetical protein
MHTHAHPDTQRDKHTHTHTHIHTHTHTHSLNPTYMQVLFNKQTKLQILRVIPWETNPFSLVLGHGHTVPQRLKKEPEAFRWRQCTSTGVNASRLQENTISEHIQSTGARDLWAHLSTTIRVLRPHPPLVSWQTGIIIPGNGGVGTLQLWTTRTILSVKMDRENSLTLLLLEWGSNPIPSDPQSEPPTTGSGFAPV